MSVIDVNDINTASEAAEVATIRADFDNMRAAIARKSTSMARAINESPGLFEAMRKVVYGVEVFRRVHRLEPDEVTADGYMTPDGRIVITLSML